MKLFTEINEISEELAKSGEGTVWGTQLDEADNFAWQAPMLGDGGSSPELSLASHLARYMGELDPTDGPDECVFVENGRFYHLVITAE